MWTGCQWPQPDVSIYIALIKGLTASLRVADALRAVGDIKRRGVPDGEEVIYILYSRFGFFIIQL